MLYYTIKYRYIVISQVRSFSVIRYWHLVIIGHITRKKAHARVKKVLEVLTCARTGVRTALTVSFMEPGKEEREENDCDSISSPTTPIQMIKFNGMGVI